MSVSRYRQLEADALRQDQIASEQHRRFERRGAGKRAEAMIAGGAGADGSAFTYVLTHAVARKTLMRTGLLALAMWAGSARLQR